MQVEVYSGAYPRITYRCRCYAAAAADPVCVIKETLEGLPVEVLRGGRSGDDTEIVLDVELDVESAKSTLALLANAISLACARINARVERIEEVRVALESMR